jgi:hypothetical protein
MSAIMFIAKKRLDRRTFLRGMGATVALPLLDAMIPARTLLASSAAGPLRLAFVYFPHGAIMDEWTPAAVTAPPGAGQKVIALSEAARRVTPAGRLADVALGRILEPLTPFRDRLTIVSGLENRHAYGPVHALTPGTWLSGRSPREHRDAIDGATADQLAADHLGRESLLPSIAVAAEQTRKIGAGIWDGEYDESYGTTISFRQARVPVPMEFRPRAVFNKLFNPTPPHGVRPRSVLDLVAGDATKLRQRLGPADRAVLADYLETLRDVERRVEKCEERVCSRTESRLRVARFGGQAQAEAAHRFTERMALMFDMTALAFRADVTRVASVMMAAEASSMTYDHLGVSESFHLLSHHQNDAEKIEKLVRIQTFHTRMFATFLRKLGELPDGDGTILDHSLIVYGSNMSNSHAHDHYPLPVAVIGGGCGRLRGGQHLRYADRTPMSNLLLTVLRRAGVPLQSVGDSTGECGEL